MRLGEAFKKIFDKETERDILTDERKAIVLMVATALQGARVGDGAEDRVQIRLVSHGEVGPLGGVSDRITIQVGDNRQTAHYFYISVYANGVMAE